MTYNTTSYKQVKTILWSSQKKNSSKPSNSRTFLPHFVPGNDFDEVFPGILLGNRSGALNKAELKRNGISHVLNCAQGVKFNQINTNEKFYEDAGMQFFGIQAEDCPLFQLSRYFQPAADYIEGALKSGGKLYVHCEMGVSRSATIVIAYLMQKQKMNVVEAVSSVKSKREIFPNSGFLKQLCEMNEELYEQAGV